MERSNHYKPVEYHTTDWEEVISSTGRKYYYNKNTRTSTWEIPAELMKIAKKYNPDRTSETPNNTLEHPTKKYKGEGLLLTPTAKSNGTSHPHPSPTTPALSTPSRSADLTSSRAAEHTSSRAAEHTTPHRFPSRPSASTSRRQSLNQRSDTDYASLHEAIPSPVINREQRHAHSSNGSSQHSSPNHPRSRGSNHAGTPGTNGPQKLSKLLSSSLDLSLEETPDQNDILRTKFLDPASISLLMNAPAELLERQSNQLHAEARRILDVELPRTMVECANLRAVQNVQSLRALNIEHKLLMLREHIKWLEEGNDLT